MTESEILRRLEDVGTLHKPLLVASFVRKNGINTTAAAALMHRIRSHDLQPIAQFDPEQFFDFTQSRPQVRNEDGGRVIEFPRNRVHLERATEGGRDALIVSGIEPHLRWRHFSEQLTSFARSVDVEAVLILRSFPANVPHTRPVLLRLTTTSEELSGELGLPQLQPSYEGPIDIGEVVASELAASGVAIGGMTVLVPNYLGVVPNPMAVLGVTRTLDRLIGAETPTGQYEEAADNVPRPGRRADASLRRGPRGRRGDGGAVRVHRRRRGRRRRRLGPPVRQRPARRRRALPLERGRPAFLTFALLLRCHTGALLDRPSEGARACGTVRGLPASMDFR